MNWKINELIPSFCPLETIKEILVLVDTIKPKRVVELLPGCGPLTWHILTNIKGIENYHAVDIWLTCGRKKLKRHGIDGYITLDLFLSYNSFTELTYEQKDFMDFYPKKNYDLWIIDHEIADDYYKNIEDIISINLLKTLAKINKDNYIMFYNFKNKHEFKHVLEDLMYLNILKIVYKLEDVMVVKKNE